MDERISTARQGLAAYRRLIAAPHVGVVATASVLARLPLGMGAVALVIYIHARTGSFGIAGFVAGAFSLGLGLTGGPLGRLVDRRGTRPVLLPASFIASSAFVAVVVLGSGGAGDAALVVAGAVAGGAAPPISGVLRPTWVSLVGQRDLGTAYLFDSILIEIVFISGPLLAGLLAATLGPAAPLLMAGALGLLGTLFFLAVPPIRGLEPIHANRRTRAGALGSPTIRLLTLIGIPVGATFGALDVALPAFGASLGSTALGGVFTAALSFGSVVGAILYGALPTRLGDLRQATVWLAVAQPLLCVPLLFAPSVGVMVVLAILAGTCVAPTASIRNRIAQTSMPAGTSAEAFTWLLAAIFLGTSAGSALAGPVVQAGGWRGGVAVAIVLAGTGLPIVLAGRSLIPRD